MDHDVITVGGGLAGAALAWKLARSGVRVLVLERTVEFRDRVRGEGLLPWGVNEARDLGIYPLLERRRGRALRYWTSHARPRRPPRDLLATTPRRAPCLTFYHPEMQEVLLAAAAEAGAEVRRGVSVRGVETGSPATVVALDGERRERLQARLIVGADGRDSRVRRWAGFAPRRAAPRLMIAGVLLDGTAVADDSVHVFRDSPAGEGALLFPLGGGRLRAYLVYRRLGARRGLSGARGAAPFFEGCARLQVPSEWLAGAELAGPLAEFEGADTWVEQPYRNGVALIGDAASSNDPAWGNGLSLTLRDVRTLSASLLESSDWSEAGRRYATAHDGYFGAIHRVTSWLTDLLYEVGPAADARRARVLPLAQRDGSRNPDFIALGPAAPSDERARRRMFGEDPAPGG